MTNVLIWYWGRRGGGAKYTLEIAKALCELDRFALHLSLSRQNDLLGAFNALGLPACHVDTLSGPFGPAAALVRLPANRGRLLRYLKDRRIDLVYGTMSTIWSGLAVGAVAASGARYLHTMHDAVAHPGERVPLPDRLVAREVAASDGLIVLSDHVRDQVTARFGYPADRLWTIPLGQFSFAEGPARPRHAPGGRPVRLLFFGRILAYKGLDLLLDAFARLRERNEVVLQIAGEGDLGPYRDRLAALGGLEIENRWIGESEMPALLAEADLMVLPYLEASQSAVAPLAYAAGLPVVATPVGGLKEQVIPGETGLLAERADAAALAESIEQLIRNPELYERCSRGALALVTETLSWSALARRVASVMDRVIAGPAR